MSAAQPIGPGSIVVCVNAPLNHRLPSRYRLTVDALYCVELVEAWGHGSETCKIDGCPEGFLLKGKTEPCRTSPFETVLVGYCPSHFRPLSDGDTSMVKDEIVEEDAIGTDGSALQTYRVKTPEPA